MPSGPQLIVDVRVVDDLAGQEHRAIGKSLARLVGVVDRAIDAVAEAELPRQMDREAAGLVAVAGALIRGDQRAVVAGGQLAGDGVLEIEALPEDQRLHGPSIIPAGSGRSVGRRCVDGRHRTSR